MAFGLKTLIMIMKAPPNIAVISPTWGKKSDQFRPQENGPQTGQIRPTIVSGDPLQVGATDST